MGAGKLTCEFCGHKAEAGSGGVMSQVEAKRIKKIRKKIKEEYATYWGGELREAEYNYVKGKSFFWRFFKPCKLDHQFKCVNFSYSSAGALLESQIDDYVEDNKLGPWHPDFSTEQEYAKYKMGKLLEEQELYGSSDILVDDDDEE